MHTHPNQTRHSADTLLLFSTYTHLPPTPSFIPFPPRDAEQRVHRLAYRLPPSAAAESLKKKKTTRTHTRTANSNQLRLHIYAAAFCTWSTQSGKQHHRRRVAVLRLKKYTDFPTSTAPIITILTVTPQRRGWGGRFKNIYICLASIITKKKQTKERK